MKLELSTAHTQFGTPSLKWNFGPCGLHYKIMKNFYNQSIWHKFFEIEIWRLNSVHDFY